MSKNIVFEIGTEELPAIELHQATNQVDKLVHDTKYVPFSFDEANVYTTPRRIIVQFVGVPEVVPATHIEHKGPSIKIAFKDGKPTKAAEGFARGKGLTADDLEIREIDGEEYVFANVDIPEKQIASMLPNFFTNLIKQISWKKVQRWGSQNEPFARPIRWIFAMFGTDVFNVEYAGVHSGNITFGHRFLSPDAKELESADDLFGYLQSAYVVLTEAEREQIIRNQVYKIEAKYELKATLPVNIMQEVVNLCEFPTCMVGQFDEEFLQVPKEIIVDTMLVHQRYFPLFTADGKLTNKFIVVSNGNPDNESTIIDGNQRVVAARLYDAQFFFEEDKHKPLESYVEQLDDVVFQEKLGTMKAKVKRISLLSGQIAEDANLSSEECHQARRAGLLAKADLVTSAVIEFTQVQGIMGSYYAKASGEDDIVAEAIGQHYMPRFAGDDVPSTNVGKCVAAADKIDSICGLFAAGQAPTGSSDPFALRRGAIGIISILQSGLSFSVVEAVNNALTLLAADGIDFDTDEIRKQVLDFIITRTKVILKDEGVDADTIAAVSTVKVEEPMIFINRCHALENARNNNSDLFSDLATAYARANNLRDSKLDVQIDKSLFEDVEKEIFEAICSSKEQVNDALTSKDYSKALSCLASLRAPIDNFFEGVMIKDKDEKLRNNRIMLLNKFVDVFTDIADFSKMAKK